MERAGRWLRVSKSEQAEANQEPEVDAYIDGKGYRAERTYRLHGKSASKGEQDQALDQAIRDIKDGVITVLVVWALDRLDRRGIAESFAIKMRIEQAGGRVEFVREPSMTDLEFAVKAFMAAEESKRKAERTEIGLAEARANGGMIGRPPWGYRVTGPKRAKRMVPTAAGARYVPVIYRRVADGESGQSIADWLNAEGEKKTGKAHWHAQVVLRLIRKRSYMGFYTAADGRVICKCPPLVDAALWQMANDALDGSVHRPHTPPVARAPLAGLVFCECGSVMYRTAKRPDGPRRYYRCQASHRVTVSCQELEAWTDEQMSGQDIRLVRETLVPGEDHSAEIKSAEYELSVLGRAGLDWEAEDAERARLRAEITRLRALPVTGPRTETEVLPWTVGDAWSMLPDWDARRAFLKATGTTVHVEAGEFDLRSDPPQSVSPVNLWRLFEGLLPWDESNTEIDA